MGDGLSAAVFMFSEAAETTSDVKVSGVCGRVVL